MGWTYRGGKEGKLALWKQLSNVVSSLVVIKESPVEITSEVKTIKLNG